MKKTFQRLLQVTLCLLLCLLMLMGVSLSGAAQSDGADVLFDYSLPTLDNKQSLSASELFYEILGSDPSKEERDYLDQLSGITLQYTDLIPPSIVSTHYNGNEGKLEVTIPAYSYVAKNGVTVEWIPQSVTLEGLQKPVVKSGDAYVCQFENLFYSKDFDIQISFAWDGELSEEELELLLTSAYTQGLEALKTVEAYEEAYLNPYLEALKRYEIYEAYQQALKDHAQYLIDVETYEKKLAEYQAYLVAYESYLAQMAAYNAYLQNQAAWEQYYAYQEFLVNDLEKYNEYLLYQGKVSKVLSKLAILESLFVSDSRGWTFYPSLMGSTVTSVTSRKDELIVAGCDEKTILNADRATKELRELLTVYSNLRKQSYASEHEKLSILYEYYTNNYGALRDSFCLLEDSLGKLYQNEFVLIKADAEGKLERFQQFIGQLYVTATCLNDDMMRRENWELSGKKLSDVVEPVNLLPDTGNSDPSEIAMPETEVERVEAVEPVEKPSEVLSPVSKPTEPKEVKEPKAPDFVAEPDKENPPPVAAHPGEAPARPPMEDALWSLALAVRDGSVPRREIEGVSRLFSLEKTVSCPISIHNLKTVTFYDVDGSTVLYQQTVDYGESVTYGGASLQKTDPYYTYTFRGWVLSDGSTPSLDAVYENLSIFANYQVERRVYRVLWILDGVEMDTYYYYGDTPKPPVSLEKPGTVDMLYRFTGWDKEVLPVTENAVYVGGFELVPRVYTVTWILGDRTVTTEVKHGETAQFAESALSYSDGTYYYRFTGWDRDLQTPVTGSKTVYAKYSKEALAKAGNGAALTVTNDGKSITVLAGGSDVFLQNVAQYAVSQSLPLTIRWNFFEVTYSAQSLNTLVGSSCVKLDLEQHTVSGGVAYTLTYADADGKDAGIRPASVISLYPMKEDGSGCQYAVAEKDQWKALTETTHSTVGGFTLLVKEACRITVGANEFCNVSAIPLYALPGEWVSLDLRCEFGYEVVGAVLTKSNGAKIEINERKFQMPVGDVSLELKVERIVYHVTFMVDGEIYHQADYFLGEEIRLPENPQKAQDETYSYAFYEWSPAVTIAMGSERDLTYKAIFSKNVLNGENPYLLVNNNKLLNTYLPIALGVIALGIFLFVFLRRRKKKGLASHTENV